jgi:ATP-dependent DNA helicase RecQ
VVDARLDRLTTYGLLRDVGADYVWSLLDALIRANCLAVSSGQYPTLSLTELGGDVMRRKKTVPLPLPDLPVRQAPSRATQSEPKRRAVESEAAAYDAKIFDALRQWRREKAVQMGGVPAYIIYPDRTLEELARRAPQTAAELLEVRGIGPAKARQFGTETIAVIRQVVSSAPR